MDRSVVQTVTEILENTPLAERTYRLRLRVPEIAAIVRPGQFVMLRLTSGDDPLLGRPLGVYRTDATGIVDLVYLVVGKMTARLAALPPGTKLSVWGPLGNGWDVSPEELDRYDHFLLVAGGIGHSPLHMLVKHCRAIEETCALLRRQGKTPVQLAPYWDIMVKPPKWTLLYGAQTERRLSCLDDFRSLGIDVRIATDDGSVGHHGYVNELIEVALGGTPPHRTKILACGPEPMLHAVWREALRLNLACDVSLETPMGCGLGICYGCVVDYLVDPGTDRWDYRRTCVDGSVFDASRLRWPDVAPAEPKE